MNLEEMNNMDPAKIPYSALTLALTNAVERLASQTAEANESLKRLAYPMQVVGKDGHIEDFTPTLRDQFAMAAMQATTGWMQDALETTPETARRCYVMADSMLEARKR